MVDRIKRVRSSPTFALPESVLSGMRFTFVGINRRSVSRHDHMEIHRSVVFHVLQRSSCDEMRSFNVARLLQREETRCTSSMFPSKSSRRTSDDWSARLVVCLHRIDRFLPRWWTRTYPTMSTIDRSIFELNEQRCLPSDLRSQRDFPVCTPHSDWVVKWHCLQESRVIVERIGWWNRTSPFER